MRPVRRGHTGIFAFESRQPANSGGEDENTIVIPENIQEISDEELDALEARAVEAFDGLFEQDPTDATGIGTLGQLADAIDVVRSERERRTTERAEAQAEASRLRNRVHGDPEDGGGDDGGDGGEGSDDEGADTNGSSATAPAAAPEPVGAVTAATVPAQPRRTQRINVPLAEIRARAPQHDVQERLAITAAADVPRYAAGHQFANLNELADAFYERSKSTHISASGLVAGPKVATIKREFKHVVSADTSPAQIQAMFDEITNPDSLVAAGGWCAPSEISYGFFDISCEDGMIDLPEFGIQRGGVRWPTSPSMADVFTGTFTNATNPWLWTESDDILTVTGSTNKPCVRVPCPTFNEARLECYGICLTAGNLTDNAYPEATQHYLGLLRSAHYHAMNQRYIATISALSSAVAATGLALGGSSYTSDMLATAEWAAIDYRTRFGMCDNDVLEMVLPTWAKAPFRRDMAMRSGVGVDAMSISDAQINGWFDDRLVRVQWVKDWQVRGVNQPGGANAGTIYPLTVDFLLYAAGTFARGNGMTLDLGVVRDSTLNAENDHTAAWSEECHLIAMRGVASRRYTVSICAGGKTGLQTVDDCGTTAA